MIYDDYSEQLYIRISFALENFCTRQIEYPTKQRVELFNSSVGVNYSQNQHLHRKDQFSNIDYRHLHR